MKYSVAKVVGIFTAFFIMTAFVIAETQYNGLDNSIVSFSGDNQSPSGNVVMQIGNTDSVNLILSYGEITLNWTAPGDDSICGCAAGYDIRYVLSGYGQINTEQRWQSAIQVDGEPVPSPAGLRDSMVITGLELYTSYYFAIKSYDEAGNFSGLSNSPELTVTDSSSAFIPGDANGDGLVIISDITYLIFYFHGIVPPPEPFLAGDANGDCVLISSDVIYLLNFFRGYGPNPVRGDCE